MATIKLNHTVDRKIRSGFVDMTPTWEETARIIEVLFCNATTVDAHNTARHELQKMARLADAYVDAVKSGRLA